MSTHLTLGRCALSDLFYVFLVGAVVPFTSCTTPESANRTSPEAPSDGPTVTQVDRVVLHQDDRHFITVPISFSILDDGSGDFVVSDGRLAKVIRFARNGSLVRAYDSGDFAGAIQNTWTVASWDSTLMIVDLVGQRMHHIHAGSGNLVRSEPFLGRIGVAVSHPNHEQWIGIHHRNPGGGQQDGVMLKDQVSGDTILLHLPDEWLRFPEMEIHSGLNVTGHGEGILMAFSAMEAILRLNDKREVVDTIALPRRHRRGVSRNILEKVGFNRREIVNNASRMVLLDRTSDGRIVVVHHDASYRTSGGLDVDVWVSLLSEDLEHACVDSRLPIVSTQTPNVYFRQDTLWVQASQVVEGRPVLEAKAFLVDAIGCEWLPVVSTADYLLP